MKYFRMTYEWRTHPWHRKGKLKTTTEVFAASNITDAYKLAREDGKFKFNRKTWRVINCEEIKLESV